MARQTLQEIRPSIDVRAAQNSIHPWTFTSNNAEADDPHPFSQPIGTSSSASRRRARQTQAEIYPDLSPTPRLSFPPFRTLISPFPIPPCEDSSPAVPLPSLVRCPLPGYKPGTCCCAVLEKKISPTWGSPSSAPIAFLPSWLGDVTTISVPRISIPH